MICPKTFSFISVPACYFVNIVQFIIVEEVHVYIVSKLLKRGNVRVKVTNVRDKVFTAQKEDQFFEKHHVRRCPIFRPKSSEDQKKDHYVPEAAPEQST